MHAQQHTSARLVQMPRVACSSLLQCGRAASVQSSSVSQVVVHRQLLTSAFFGQHSQPVLAEQLSEPQLVLTPPEPAAPPVPAVPPVPPEPDVPPVADVPPVPPLPPVVAEVPPLLVPELPGSPALPASG